MEKILTVVVPTYNAEKYLRDNLESFCIDELFSDVDILIINDGSTDGSLGIAEEYVKRYPSSFRVISKENGGHGSGINWGIKNAVGKYFKIVDADDWVDKDAFKRLVGTLKTQDADIVYSGFLWAFDMGQTDKSMFEVKAEITRPFRGIEYLREYIFDDIADQLYIKMHNLTMKTEILKKHHICVDENCYYVDTEYITYPVPYVNTICFIDDFVYYYRIGRCGQSVGIDKMQQNEKNYDLVTKSLLDFYSKLGSEIPCTDAKRKYIAKIIARVVAGKIKIMLSFPATKDKKVELRIFNETLKHSYPDVYRCNINWAVASLRRSRYVLYSLASFLVRRKYH